MNVSIDRVATNSTTSGGSSLMASSVLAVACVIGAPGLAAGTSGHGAPWDSTTHTPRFRVLSPTASGGGPSSDASEAIESDQVSVSAQDAIAELRRLSGLTWEQMAGVLGVSRRSLHFWASGKPMLPANEERLQRVLRAVRAIDRGSSSENRRLLVSAGRGNAIALDLLAAEQYDEVLAILGAGPGPRAAKSVRLRDEAPSRRRPQSIGDRAASTSDQAHRDPGKRRSVRIARRK